MAFATRIISGGSSSSGNFNTKAAGDTVSGSTITIDMVEPPTLSALVALDAETDTITLTPYWEVSADQTTWYRVYDQNGTASTAQATGTAGADATVSRVLNAPGAVYGWRFCRVTVVVGVTTGATADTYAISYNYARKGLNG